MDCYDQPTVEMFLVHYSIMQRNDCEIQCDGLILHFSYIKKPSLLHFKITKAKWLIDLKAHYVT